MAKAKKVVKQKSSESKSTSPHKQVLAWFAGMWQRADAARKGFLARRPHRSFRLTRRRDYTRSLQVPGYIAFTLYVTRMLREQWKVFLPIALLYGAIMIALGAITSQETYATLSGLLSGASEELFSGGPWQLAQAGLIAIGTFASTGTTVSADQGVYLAFSIMFVWLATVWLLRERLAGRSPKVRDGLYNSGAPILSTVGVLLVMVVQFFPIGIAMLLYAGLSTLGLVSEGFGSMLFWLFASVVACLVAYWVTSTIIALVVVTIPGMYPLRALQLSGDLVVGRRLRIMFRLVWGLFLSMLGWILLLLVSILVDELIKNVFPDIADISLVPYISVFAGAAATVWFAAYTYLFYRRVVDDDAKPA